VLSVRSPWAHHAAGTVTIEKRSTRREDDQLFAMLDERHRWTANGPSGEVLAMTASLREAIQAAEKNTTRGQRVSASVQKSSAYILVFAGQIDAVRLQMNSAA
jgi:hypothetical protein